MIELNIIGYGVVLLNKDEIKMVFIDSELETKIMLKSGEILTASISLKELQNELI